MKTAVLCGFIVFFTFGAVDVVISTAIDDVNHCLQVSFFNDSSSYCPDYASQVACIEKIDPVDDIEKSELEQVLSYTREEANACPGLNTREKCISSEKRRCMQPFYSKKYIRSKEVCDEAPKAKDCLLKLNSTCNRDVISFEMGQVDNVTALCASGHYGDGPCSPSKVNACTMDVLSDYQVSQKGIDYVFEYKCQPGKVKTASDCLADLSTHCQTQAMQREVEFESKYLTRTCPPNQ